MTKYGRKRRLFVPVYQFPVLPQLPSSDLCHNLSAHSHSSPALIYISDITSGPGCTQGSAAFSYTPPAFFFLDVFVPSHFVSVLFFPLSLQLPVPSTFPSLLNPNPSLSPNLLCIRVPEFTPSQRKDGFAHMCAAKSCRPSETVLTNSANRLPCAL